MSEENRNLRFEPGTVPQCLCLVLAAAVTFQLFYLGGQPSAAGLIPAPWDKLAHVVVYVTITLLLWIGTAGRMPLAVIASVIAIGALDELHQASIPGRFADAVDFFADACAAIGTGAVMLLLDARRRTDRRASISVLLDARRRTDRRASISGWRQPAGRQWKG